MGKGKKGVCSKERGLTLTSNFGKVFERIIDQRIKKEIIITDAQLGGKAKSSTVDHIYTIKELAKLSQNRNQSVYLTYLDVQKAYDKAWNDGIMYAMYTNGLKSRLWKMVQLLTKTYTAQVKTKFGLTNTFSVTNTVRQGGVLAVTQYALMMDEVAKEINNRNIGIEMDNGKKIGCLLWVDDIVLLSNTKREMQKLLNITNSIATKYRLQFSPEKIFRLKT